jgi:hypothetical protein
LKMSQGRFLVNFFLLCSVVLSSQLFAQFDLIHNVDVPIKFATTDKLQQIYVVTPEDKVIKFDPRGKEMTNYTNNYLGDIQWVDPTNPINIVVYYPDLQTLVTLDVTMNEISRTNLVNFGFFNIKAICSSNDGNIWIYDDLEFRLKKIDRNGRILMSSENLLLLLNGPFKPTQMQERNNRVFALIPDEGIYIFDNMGNFDTVISNPDILRFQLSANKIGYIHDGKPFLMEPPFYLPQLLDLPDSDRQLIDFQVQVDKLYLFYQTGFQVWKWK